ncbi:hypothetical protein CRE_17486 [Caenorhabditis remanei]|uniref:ELM2 domain-containing protein n=1 Tax=Caenorhabditis remanei TaxID=31234 RepID=E3N7U9_CAERE|nr:hypothetical protein CRE_17486 [Caenorhabditis remanei]
MIGYNYGGVPDTKYAVTKELTLEEAARRTKLPKFQVFPEKIYVSFPIFKAQKIFNIFQPIGFIFKEKEVYCMKCGRQFKCPTTEKKVVYDCHARLAWSGHPRVIDAETYIIKIVGKEVFVPHRVEFDRDGIEEGAEPLAEPEGQSHPESLENQKEPEYITLSDDENDHIKFLGIVRKPPVPGWNDSRQIAREVAAAVLRERDMEIDEPPRQRDRSVSDNSDIEIIENVPIGARADAPGPEFDAPSNDTETLAPEVPKALKRAGSPVEMISAKRFSKNDSDAHSSASAPYPEALSSSEINKNPEDNSLEESEDAESQEPSPIKNQREMKDKEDPLLPATEADDGFEADGEESDEDVENEEKLGNADLDKSDMNKPSMCDPEDGMSPGPVDENISEITSENQNEESREGMSVDHPEEKSPDLNSAEPHDVESEKFSENQNEESGEDMYDSLADKRAHQTALVFEEPDVEMEDATVTEQPLLVETDDVTFQKGPESPTTCSPILHSLLLDQSPRRRTMSVDPNLDEEESGVEKPQDARDQKSMLLDDDAMDVEDSKKVELELEAPGPAPAQAEDIQMEVDKPEKVDEIVEEKEKKEDAKRATKEPPVNTRARRGARPIMIQIDRGTSIPTGLTRKPFHFEVNAKSIFKKQYKGKPEVPIREGAQYQAELPELPDSGGSSDEESMEEEVYWEPVEEEAGKSVEEKDMDVYQRAILLTFNGHIPMEKALGHLRKCDFDFGDALDSIDQCLKDLPQAMKPICYGQAKNLAMFLMMKDGKWRKHIQEQAMRNYHLVEIQNFMYRTMVPKYVNRHTVILPNGEDDWIPRGERPCTCHFFTHEDIEHEPRISCTNCTKKFRNVEGLPDKLCLVCQAYQGFKKRRRPAENVVFNDDDLKYLKKWDTYERSNNHRISKADFDKLLLEQNTARWQRLELTEEEKDMVDWTAKKLNGWNERLEDAKESKYGEPVATQLQPFVIPYLSRCRCKESGNVPRNSENWEKRTFEKNEQDKFRDAILKHDGDQMAAAEELDVEAELVERFAQMFPSGIDLYEKKTFELRHRPILPHTDLPPPPPIPIVFKEKKQRGRAKVEIDEDDVVREEKDTEYDPNENKKISQDKAKKKRAAAAKAAAKKKPTAPKKPATAAPKPPPSAPRKPPTPRQPPQEPQITARELRAKARQ